jgi:uncharacterized protein
MVYLFIVLLLLLIGVRFARRVIHATPGERGRVLRREAAMHFVPLAIAYGGVVWALVCYEPKLIFENVSADEGWQMQTDPTIQDVMLSTRAGARVHAWWHPVKDARWVVLYCHGAGGNVSYLEFAPHIWQHFANASLLMFDYPGYGRSEGAPNEAGCYAATEAAYDWLIEELQVDPRKLIVHGESLGGAMAVDIAVRRPHRALILIGTFSSIPDMAFERFPLFPGRWLVQTQFDNLAKIRNYHNPLFMAHGTEDPVIPFAHGERLFEAAGTEMKVFHRYPNRGHDFFWNDFLFVEIAKFLHDLPDREQQVRETARAGG